MRQSGLSGVADRWDAGWICEQRERVDSGVVPPNREVEMGSCDAARGADSADGLTPPYLDALLDRDLRQVEVHREQLIAVIDEYRVACEVELGCQLAKKPEAGFLTWGFASSTGIRETQSMLPSPVTGKRLSWPATRCGYRPPKK